MPPRTSPFLQKTIAMIREIVSKDPVKLPSVRSIAAMCGVSTVTVCRALEQLKKEGILGSRWGKGYYPAGVLPASPGTAAEVRTPKYQRIHDALTTDILNGAFTPNLPLPGVNKLGALYGASRPTIRRALETLLSEKMIRRIGVRYFLYKSTIRTRTKIAIVAFGLSRGEIKITSERERNFYRNITNAALRQQVDLQTICYNDYLDTPRFHLPGRHDLGSYFRQAEIRGIILSTFHMNRPAECLRKIAAFGKPVSICVEDQGVLESMTRSGAGSKGITYFDVSYSTLPGRDVGKYLQEKGHREIAYISPFHASAWSRNRLAGLMETDPPLKVHAFVRDEYDRDYAFMEKILEKPLTKDTETFMARSTAGVPPFMRKRIKSVKMEFDCLLRDASIFSYCEPLFKSAASIPAITAWVCANDQIACLVMDYWNFCGVPETERPALVGFDNAFDTFERGISTYEFDTGGETQSMVNHLLYPKSLFFLTTKRIVRLRGSIIERASSSREPVTTS